jgi:hypothetical protein
VATFSRLKSGSWRAQVRRKGKYVNETFRRRKDAEEWALDIERRIDRQEPATTRSRDAKLVSNLIALHRADLEEVGKKIGRSKDASLNFLDERIGHLRIGELDRERLVKFGKERASEGAGPVTVGMDLGYIKTITCVHGISAPIEPINLARIALGRLGLVGKGNERVTYQNADNGFCVIRVNARGHRDLVTVVGHAAVISAGEWITAAGEWTNDRTHGQQFKARFLKTSSPTSIEGIEKYLGSGMIRGIGPVYAKKLLCAFGEKVFDIIGGARPPAGCGQHRPGAGKSHCCWLGRQDLRRRCRPGHVGKPLPVSPRYPRHRLQDGGTLSEQLIIFFVRPARRRANASDAAAIGHSLILPGG